MKRFLPVLLFVVLGGIFSSGTVHACSGARFIGIIDQQIEMSDVVVIGQFVELDDVNLNGIFQVDAYLKGEGPEYITIGANNVIEISKRYALRRFSIGDCGGYLTNSFNISDQYIFVLWHDSNGSYYPRDSFLQVSEEVSTFPIIFNYHTEEHEVRHLTLDEFRIALIEMTNQYPKSPEANSIFPRTTPVLITLQNGKEYMLPLDELHPFDLVDSAVVRVTKRNRHECNTTPCMAFSYSGTDMIMLVDNEADKKEVDLFEFYQVSRGSMGTLSLFGERIIFSPMNDAVVRWHDGLLRLHVFWSDRFPHLAEGPQNINSIPISDASLSYPAVWSPDGRTFVYSDERGLWSWDVFAVDFPPRLLLSSTGDSVPFARYFSPKGRYLAVTDGTSNYNLDLLTGIHYPDGILSPDDRTLLAYDTLAFSVEELTLISLAPYHIIGNFDDLLFVDNERFSDPVWIDEWNFAVSSSGQGYEIFNEGSPNTYVDEPWGPTTNVILARLVKNSTYRGRFADYHKPTNSLLTIVNDHTIAINNEIIDLSEYFDEPIVSAEWLPSVFYYKED